MKENFYTKTELEKIGFQKYGENVSVSRKASIFAPEKISLGNNVRIDDFSILSGKITIGSNIHIAAGVKLYGGSVGIELCDYTGCSANCILYSVSDDFSGDYMVGAVLPKEVRNVKEGKIILEKYAQLGANTIVMPGTVVKEGAVTGAMTFVNSDLEPWTINVGIPAKVLKKRSRELLKRVDAE